MSKAPDNKVSYSYSFSVTTEHIDALNHVNNVMYLQWVQDASEKHWVHLTNEAMRSQNVWMALRHEIDYLGQAFLNDKLTVYTWIEDAKGVKSTRIIHIYKEEALLVKCRTNWVLFDAKRLKPKRIGEELRSIFEKS